MISKPIINKPADTDFQPGRRGVYRRIDEAKRLFKGQQDLMYVSTLLISLTNELKKLDVSMMAEDKKEPFFKDILIPALTAVKEYLTKAAEECGKKTHNTVIDI